MWLILDGTLFFHLSCDKICNNFSMNFFLQMKTKIPASIWNQGTEFFFLKLGIIFYFNSSWKISVLVLLYFAL